MSRHFFLTTLVAALVFSVPLTHAQATDVVKTEATVSIKEAWARATNPGQEVGAAYMTLTSNQDVALVKIQGDVTDSIEIHSMSMQNGVMKMRMLDKIALTAGKPYQLAPGGFHLMLFDLKKPLVAGEQLNLVLSFKDKNNVTFQQKTKIIVKSSEDAATGHEHHH